jgi:membrane dipeptidase
VRDSLCGLYAPGAPATLGQVAAARRSGMTATNNTISDDTEDLFENLNELAASVESHTDALTIIRKYSDIARAKRENKVGIIQGFQQTSCFENGLERIDAFRKHGVRIMQITYTKRNALGDGCLEPANAGLTNAGIAAVRRTTWVSG